LLLVGIAGTGCSLDAEPPLLTDAGTVEGGSDGAKDTSVAPDALDERHDGSVVDSSSDGDGARPTDGSNDRADIPPIDSLGDGAGSGGAGGNGGTGGSADTDASDGRAGAGGSGGNAGAGGSSGTGGNAGAGGSSGTGGSPDASSDGADASGDSGRADTSDSSDAADASDSTGDKGGSDGDAGCVGGVGVAGPSCSGLAATCGPNGNANCCASSVVCGGTYNRSNDATHPATVSDFRLDTYEITVGRFRKFAAVYTQAMTPSGAGKNPNNIPSDTGWDTAWNASLPIDATALTDTTSGVQCNATYQTWTASAAGNESRPINCITWYTAEAFCIWDGGRLPTEAEWNYAAASGSEQRQYPWSNPPSSTTIDDTYAVYCGGSCSSTQNVGTKSTLGDGKWGQADLAGNVYEWVQDWYAYPYSAECNNCANLTAASTRVLRGGSFYDNAFSQLSSNRSSLTPTNRHYSNGARCARTP
jgi:formylglycine-generating enzyme required for sulfatase activity